MKKIFYLFLILINCFVIVSCKTQSNKTSDWNVEKVHFIKEQFGKFSYKNINTITKDDFVVIDNKSELKKFINTDDPKYNKFKNYDDVYFVKNSLIVVPFIDHDNYDYDKTNTRIKGSINTNTDLNINRFIYSFKSYNNDLNIYVTGIFETKGLPKKENISLKFINTTDYNSSFSMRDYYYYDFKEVTYYKYDVNDLNQTKYLTYINTYDDLSKLINSENDDYGILTKYPKHYFKEKSLIFVTLKLTAKNSYCKVRINNDIMEISNIIETKDTSEYYDNLFIIECNRKLYDEEIGYYKLYLKK